MKRTTKEGIAALILFIIIGLIIFAANRFNDYVNERRHQDRIDQIQIQEMKDYHNTQGRNIITF